MGCLSCHEQVCLSGHFINNNGDKKTITYKLTFIDSYRFVQNSLSELVDYTSEIFGSKECKSCIERIKINPECSYVGLKNDSLIYKCKECRKECKRPIDELKEKFPNIYQFCNDDLNKFVLLLKKGVYPYEYMDSWEKLMKLHYHPKKLFIVI